MTDVDNDIVLRADSLSKTYHDGELRVDVLKSVSIDVRRGETLAILGASGSGKSTLLHLLGGLEQASSGTVELEGRDLARCSESERGVLRNKNLGFVYQFHHLLPEFNAIENVAMPLLIAGAPIAECRERAIACLSEVGLDHRLEHRPAELSGGERQRTAIARALVARPRCVLADEPTGNLDRASAERAMASMMSLRESHGAALIVVTHDEAIAQTMERAIILRDGELLRN